ncbi:MAG: hypothetical protein ACKVVT_16850 [Dehalococcoidia bacterium]
MSSQAAKQASAPPPPPAGRPSLVSLLFGPWGLAGLLLIAAVVFGLLYALKDGSATEVVHNIVGCDPVKDPVNCKPRTPIHEHANFALFIRGQKFDFNKAQFISTGDKEIGSIAHIHPPRFGVVHTHMSNTTWSEFFAAIGFELTDPSLVAGTPDRLTCLKLPDGQNLCGTGNEKLRFMVNGVKVQGVAKLVISDLDRVVIAYGTETDEQLLALYVQVGDDACVVSESCPWRIDPNEEKEICQGQVVGCAK